MESNIQLKLISTKEIILKSFNFYRKNWFNVVAIFFIPLLIALANATITVNARWMTIAAIGILMALASVFARIALIYFVTEQGNLTFKEAYSNALHLFWPFVWITILMSLVNLGGFILVIIPGIVFVLYLAFAPYIFFAEKKRGFSALISSWDYVKGYWWAIFWRGFVLFMILGGIMIIFSIIISIPIILLSSSIYNGVVIFLSQCVSYLFFTPLITIFPFFIYESLREIKAVKEIQIEQEKKSKRILLIFIFIAITTGILIIALSGFLFAWIGKYYLTGRGFYMPNQNFINIGK